MVSKLNTSQNASKFVIEIIKNSNQSLLDNVLKFIRQNGTQNIETYLQILSNDIDDKLSIKPKKFFFTEQNYGYTFIGDRKYPKSLYLIDIYSIIVNYLRYPKLLNFIKNPKTSEKNFCSFFDGNFFRSYKQNPSLVPIFISLYADEINLVNPIGNKKRQEKILNIYGQVLNFPPHLLSTIESVFMIGTVNTRNLGSTNERAFDPVYKMIKEASEKLAEDGFDLQIGYFCGDTPIVQSIRGFVESVGSAEYPCGMCFIKKTEITSILTSRGCKLRNISDYTRLNESSTKCGQKRMPCILKYSLFDPIHQAPVDIMHCILEGCCRRQSMRIFEKWTESKRCTAIEINDCLQTFNYNYMHKKNKISNFTSYDLTKENFITSSAEMKTLFILFPFIFRQIIDINDQEYK